jgi:predicted SprT family Zn-dependent metalloprotease
MVREGKRIEEMDVHFEEVSYRCRCGYEGKEVIVVANNVGILDTRCEKCNRRIIQFKIIEK